MESFQTYQNLASCAHNSAIDDTDLIKVGDDTISIDVSHDNFDTSVPLVAKVHYTGNYISTLIIFSHSLINQ